MIAYALALLFFLGGPQQSNTPADLTLQQNLEQAKARSEAYRQAAIHINDLAGNIHSEADARAFVDAVAEQVFAHRYPNWVTLSIRQRLVHVEFQVISDPTRLIPEQRIVDVWNEYARELDSPEETLVTLAEMHNLRDAMYTLSRSMWKKEKFPQSLWIMPDIYALGADGKVAGGCRAIEALKILHDMFRFPQNVISARERVRKGVLVSDLAKQREKDAPARPQPARAELMAVRNENPMLRAETAYVQAHGERDYQRLLERLFAELFPAD
jgi:hypothetical protein